MVWREFSTGINFLSGLNEFLKNRIYLLFEKGETVHGSDRIVQVATHVGEPRLRERLLEHLTPNRDRNMLMKHISARSLEEKTGYVCKICRRFFLSLYVFFGHRPDSVG